MIGVWAYSSSYWMVALVGGSAFLLAWLVGWFVRGQAKAPEVEPDAPSAEPGCQAQPDDPAELPLPTWIRFCLPHICLPCGFLVARLVVPHGEHPVQTAYGTAWNGYPRWWLWAGSVVIAMLFSAIFTALVAQSSNRSVSRVARSSLSSMVAVPCWVPIVVPALLVIFLIGLAASCHGASDCL